MGLILVADDNDISLDFFCEGIALAGHSVAVARDGGEAHALALGRAFDLMLLDLRMPVMDGACTLRSIRAAAGPSQWTRALATSADSAVCRNALQDAGFEDLLLKPITIHALHGKLAEHIGAADHYDQALLDNAVALENAGGNASIVGALRRLLAGELDALPDEFARFRREDDNAALRDRLHRLDASAGFCGTPQLARAVRTLRAGLETADAWPDRAIAAFLATSARTRTALS